MGYCPKCRYEYEDHVHRCPDCNEELIESLVQEDPELAEKRFVPMPGLPGRVYAEMVKSVLEKQGIPCYIRADGVTDTLGISGTSPVAGTVRIFVPEDRLKACINIQQNMLNHI
ncbi:MAG TPA: hypothetical protein ENN03_04310 [bacterium]|nr:hypothetical protein [bacterium]